MRCDICKGEHPTWECPDAREALDIPSLRTAYLAALMHIEELWADNARLSDSLATCEMDARDQADKIRTIKAANANYQAVHREQILRIAELEAENAKEQQYCSDQIESYEIALTREKARAEKAEAERDARVPFEEHAAEVKRVFREGILMAFSGTAESVIDMRWHESNAQRRLTERREGAQV